VVSDVELTPEQERAGQRAALALLSDYVGDWQGIPVPLPDCPLQLAKGHPMRELYRSFDGAEFEIEVGGPDLPDGYTGEEVLVNQWFSRKLNATIHVWKASGKGVRDRYFATRLPRSPDGSMERLTYWLTTLGATDAWDLEAERRAQLKLVGLLSERQWRMYELVGCFLETSKRSGLMYLFRKNRPTVVLTPRWPWWGRKGDTMRCLAVLCLHPVGYYRRTWGGCMVPTDDVIAHLLLMRGDEARYWKQAVQHESWQAEAGL
jgi:hypothetical protein